MQKTPAIPTALVVALLFTATIAQAIPPVSLLTGRVRLAPVAEVGPPGQDAVRGRAAIIDNSEEIVVRANATGLDPKQSYVSLFYDRGSVATGPDACTGDAFVVGEWGVDDQGRGSLRATQTTSFRLSDFRTMSIRRVTDTGLELVACGRIVNR